jgi:hypothetical protein
MISQKMQLHSLKNVTEISRGYLNGFNVIEISLYLKMYDISKTAERNCFIEITVVSCDIIGLVPDVLAVSGTAVSCDDVGLGPDVVLAGAGVCCNGIGMETDVVLAMSGMR